MAEIDDDGRYRVCIAEVSRSKRVTLKRCARRARDRYDIDAVNAVYLAYAGEH